MCLLAILVVVAYDVLVIQPFSDKTSVPTTRYRSTTKSFVVFDEPWSIYPVSVLFQTPGNLHHLIC